MEQPTSQQIAKFLLWYCNFCESAAPEEDVADVDAVTRWLEYLASETA